MSEILPDGRYKITFLTGQAKFIEPTYKIEMRADGVYLVGEFVSLGPMDAIGLREAHRILGARIV